MPFIRPQYFPKHLFFRFLLQQAALLPVVGLSLLAARGYLAASMSEAGAAVMLPLVDKALVVVGLVVCAAFSGLTLLSGYNLVLPLGRILVKARSIQRRDYSLRDDELTGDVEEPSEWSDLETTIHKIGRELQKRDTSLTRERQQVEAVMSALTEAVAAVDRTGNMLFFNTKFAVLFGGDGVKGGRLSDFIRAPDVLEGFRATLREGTPRQVATHFRLKGESSSRHFSISMAPLRNEKQEIYGAIAVFHDLTEIRRMDQVRIDFVANVSHEIRSPLTSIKGYAQTLKMDVPPDAPAHKFLDTIERNTDRLIALVHDLLNLSSLESGVDLDRQEIRLADLTARVVAAAEPLRAARNHEISVDVRTPLLTADTKRVEQVLQNLVENALKYVPPGGKVGITWSAEGDEVQLHVSDNGPGIPVEHHGRVFERFYRVDASRSREQGGTGLGLAIVKHIMQRHGGRIELRPSPGGRGAEFICHFPRAAAGQADA